MFSTLQRKLMASALGVVLGVSVGTSAEAATRTVCLEFEIVDDRYDCTESTDIGVTRACNPGGYASAEGFVYQLWDADGSVVADDDMIAEIMISGPGMRCYTFEWENNPISAGEADPDVYPRLRNMTEADPGGPYLLGREGDGTTYPITTWRGGAAQFNNCTGTCTLNSGNPLHPTTNAASAKALMHMAIDSAQRTMEAAGAEMLDSGSNIDFYVDDLADLPSPGDTCTTACVSNRTTLFMPINLADDGDRAAHELAHIVQMRQFGQNSLPGNCNSDGDDGWSVTGTEDEGCATTEGFASYLAAVAWYNPNTGSTSMVPRYSGSDLEQPDPQGTNCTTAARIPLQVMRGFWDLDDGGSAVNEAGAGEAAGIDDTQSLSTTSIIDVWGDFPNGLFNHQNDETGADGGNMWDYDFNAGVSDNYIDHNCLDAQTTN